MYLKT